MKKLTALMLSSAMMLSLAACGGSASTETVSSEAASSEAASSEAVSTEEAASADAAALTTVNAGKLLHLPRRLMEPGLIAGIVVATEVEERGALSHAREPPPLVRAIYNNVPQPPLRVNAARGARRLLEIGRAHV